MFKDNLVLIVPSNIKDSLIEKVRKENNLLDITFITKSEFIKKVTFDYDNKTIYYLMNKYNIKYEVAKIYLDNIYCISDKEYKSSKLNKLVDIKKELIDNNLLIIDKYYSNYLKSKNICVYGFDYIDKYFLSILNKFDNIEIINKEYNNYDINTIYEFDDIELEIEYVVNKICELIDNNVDINRIKLVISSEYNSYIDRIFKLYNIPISVNKTSIYNTYVGSYFIDNIESDINNTLLKIEQMDSDIYNKIINILNKYTWCDDYLLVKDMLIYDFKNTYISNELVNSIEVISLKDNNISEEDYVFVMGFNQGSIPIIYTDEEYITDNICDEVLECLELALEKFTKMRNAEGIKIKEDLQNRIKKVEEQLEKIVNDSSTIVQEYIEKLENRVNEILKTDVVDKNILAQEIVIYSDKCSIEEELTRLNSHISQFKNLIEENEPIGKKIDFLIQEMNREVNTIGSKSGSIQITNAVIELKTVLEDIREQIQNIE